MKRFSRFLVALFVCGCGTDDRGLNFASGALPLAEGPVSVPPGQFARITSRIPSAGDRTPVTLTGAFIVRNDAMLRVLLLRDSALDSFRAGHDPTPVWTSGLVASHDIDDVAITSPGLYHFLLDNSANRSDTVTVAIRAEIRWLDRDGNDGSQVTFHESAFEPRPN